MIRPESLILRPSIAKILASVFFLKGLTPLYDLVDGGKLPNTSVPGTAISEGGGPTVAGGGGGGAATRGGIRKNDVPAKAVMTNIQWICCLCQQTSITSSTKEKKRNLHKPKTWQILKEETISSGLQIIDHNCNSPYHSANLSCRFLHLLVAVSYSGQSFSSGQCTMIETHLGWLRKG